MKLAEICEVYSGYALKEFNNALTGRPVIKIGNILYDGSLSLKECQYTTESVNEKYLSKKGDIFIALSGATTGKIGIMHTHTQYVINQRVGIVRRKDIAVPEKYIKYFLIKNTEKILQDAAGCAQPNVSPKQIAQYELPNHNKADMNRISETLDVISDIIAKRKQELQALNDLVKARFVEMFENSQPKSVEDVCEFFKIGPFGSALHKNEISNEGFAFVLGTDNAVKNEFAYNEIRYISEDKYHELDRYTVTPGDIIMSMMGTVGRVSVIPKNIGKAIISSHLCILRTNQELMLPEFFHVAFCKDDVIQHQIDGIHNGSIMKGFNLKIVKAFMIKCPTLKEQKAFLGFKKEVDKSKFAVQKALNETQTF